MRCKWVVLFVFVLNGYLQMFGQSPTEAEGTVRDKKTLAPLSYANVKFKGVSGTVHTDSAGYFRIITPQQPNKLIVSYLGYGNTDWDIQPGKNNHLTIDIDPININLKEVVVKPGKRKKRREIDTLALYVYHQVLENKDENKASSLNSYHYREYTRMNFGMLNPTEKFINAPLFRPYKFFFEKRDTTEKGQINIPLMLSEDYRETYYRKKPQKRVSIIHYRRLSGMKNPIFIKLIGYHFEVTDAYENVHVIFQKSFISPFAPAARGVYNFHLLDTAKIEGRTSYKLNFVGRVKEDLCLKGYAWIDSATWAIKFISYRPNEKANMNYIYDLLEEQTFAMIDSAKWMMVKEHQELEGNLLRQPGKLSLRLTKDTWRKDIDVNIEIPDSIAKAPDDLVDSDAYKKKLSYIDSVRFDSLSISEKLVYHHFDTVQNLPAYKTLMFVAHLVSTANIKAGPVDFGRLYRVVSRNNIEGWRLRMGIYTNSDLDDRFFFGAYGAYGTKDKDWKYGVNLRFKLPSKFDRWHAIEAEYKSDMLILGQENPLLTYDNVLTLIGGYNLSRVMKTREFNLYYERDWIKGLSSNITFTNRTFLSVPGAFDFSTSDATGHVTYLPQFTTTELSADLRYCKKENYYEYYTYRTPLQSKTPSITFKYTLGLQNKLLGGDYTYHKFSVQYVQRIQIPVIGYTKLMLRGGYILGNAPYPLAYITSSNTSWVRDDLSFQSTAPFEFVTDKFFTIWWEHYFDGFFLNRIPGINRLHLREFFQVKAVIGDYSSHNKSLLTVPNEIHVPGPVPYVEAGFGIENILKIFQINFLWRVTYRDNPNAANFTVKVGIYPGF